MAMLAEKRRKQKWSLNPRGKQWSEDSSKFGQKMLEKMGWMNGKGLGAKLDGITEHIKVSYKNDSQGMGFKENTEKWKEHDSNFSELLEQLSNNHGQLKSDDSNETQQISSLEEKSANSRARVHYRKFTRGKDLSRYTEKQLANIFGKKTLKPQARVPSDDEVEEIEAKQEDNSHSGNYISGGSMIDYFKRKRGESVVLNRSENDVDSESELSMPSFGFGFTSNEDTNKVENKIENEHVYEEVENISKKHKYCENIDIKLKKKKSKTDIDFESSGADNLYEVKTRKTKSKQVICNNIYDECKPKKMKKLKRTVDQAGGIENPSFANMNDSGVSLEPTFVEEFEIKRVKKKKSKDDKKYEGVDNPALFLSDSVEEAEPVFETAPPLENIEEPVKNKKKRKKRESECTYDNPALNITDSEVSLVEDCSSQTKKPTLSKQDEVVIEDDLMLNVAVLPVKKKEASITSLKKSKRKSVRFSDVHQERIIPSNYDNKIMEEQLNGTEGNIVGIAQTLDRYQAEVENDLNEAKASGRKHTVEVSEDIGSSQTDELMVGEPGIGCVNNELTKTGYSRLSYSKANLLARSPAYMRKHKPASATSSYKHLIRGDIIAEFPHSNLFDIAGYGSTKCGQEC